ncbi:hypothetical protein FO519_003080 [Halicephalobus sp. NKZ332]|nr:hypothetical protein FO519_003080 [Halicephalobus sp. NKZ332]
MKILIFFLFLIFIHTFGKESDEFSNSTISNFIIRPEGPGEKGPSLEFMPHFDQSSYDFMIPEGMNNEEAIVAVVRFYGLLTKPSPEFRLVGDEKNWFKVGEIEVIKETNYMVISVPLLMKEKVDIVYQEQNQGLYSFKITAKSEDFEAKSDVNVEILSFGPGPETSSKTSEPEVLENTPLPENVTNEEETRIETTTPEPTIEESVDTKVDNIEPEASVVKEIKDTEAVKNVEEINITEDPKDVKDIEDVKNIENTETVKNIEEIKDTENNKEVKDTEDSETVKDTKGIEVVNTKTQLPVETIEFFAIQNSTLPIYEIRANLNDSVKSELLELRIEPEEFFEARPRFILNRYPSQIKIKNVDGIEKVKEIRISAVYAEVDSDIEGEYRIQTKPVSVASPRFEESKYEFMIPENSPSGTLVGEFHAEDASGDGDSKLIYSLVGKGSELFFLSSGKITLVCPSNATCLDRERQKTYYLVSFATTLSGASTDPVTIDDKDSDEVNENALVLQGSGAQFLSFKKISEKNYILEISKNPEIGGYILDLYAQDEKNENMKSPKKSITVEVLNNSGKAKFGRMKYERKIKSELLTKGAHLIKVDFEDQAPETLKFVFLDENPGWIGVDEFGGNIFVNDVPREGIPSGDYDLTLAAIERQTNKILDRCEIQITVEESQFSTSIFTKAFYSFFLEKSKISKDFSFSPLKNKNKFEIVPESLYGFDGEIREVKLSPNVLRIYDGSVFLASKTLSKINNIQFQLVSSENSEDRVLCTVYVLGDMEKYEKEKIRKSKPVFSSPWTDEEKVISIIVPEETPLGHTVLHLPVFDPESGDPVQQVNLEGEGSDFFLYDPLKQSLLVNKLIDFEKLDSKKFNLFLTAKNHISQASAKIEIVVKNLDDNPPEVRSVDGEPLKKPLILEIPENSSPGKSLTKFLIEDKDNLENSNFVFDLGGEYAHNFQLQGNGNTVTLLTSPSAQFDFETDPEQSLLITVKDRAGNSDTVEILISLMDENDNRPVIKSSRKNFNVVDNWPIGAEVGRISATDKDSNENGRISFSISGPATKFLAVNEGTGYLSTTTSLSGLASSNPYKFEIIAMDHGSPNFTTTSQFEITVVDSSSITEGNDGELRFVSPSDDFVLTVPEDTSINTRLLTAEAVGGEGSGNIRYSLLPLDQKSLGINSVNGEIYVLSHLDFETEPYITLNIIASDAYDSGRNTSRLLRITVQNVDDNQPEFIYHPEENGILTLVVDDTVEDSEEKKIGKIQAVDLDSPPFNNVFYYLFACSGSSQSHNVYQNSSSYRIDRTSGDLFKLQKTGKDSEFDPVCALASSASDLSEDIIRQLDFDPSNPSMIKLQIRGLSSVMESEVNQQPKIKTKNETIVNIDGDGSSYSIPFHLDEHEDGFLYKLQDVKYTPLGLGENGFQLPNVFVDPVSAEIRVDPEIVEFPQGIYHVLIKAFYGSNGESAGTLVSQLHRVNRENKLKFVFDDSLDEVGSRMDSFKTKFQSVLDGSNSTKNIRPIFSTPERYSGRRSRSSVCFHLSRPDHLVALPEAVNITSTQLNPNGKLVAFYQEFKVINIESCEMEKPAEVISEKMPRNLLFWISGIFIGILILAALIFYTCFVTRYRDHLQKRNQELKEKNFPPPDPFSIPQFIDPRKF